MTSSLIVQRQINFLPLCSAERAARAESWAIKEFDPEAIVSFGFCSAAKDHERSGDIVIAARVVSLPGTPFEWSIVDDTESLGPDRTVLLALTITTVRS